MRAGYRGRKLVDHEECCGEIWIHRVGFEVSSECAFAFTHNFDVDVCSHALLDVHSLCRLVRVCACVRMCVLN